MINATRLDIGRSVYVHHPFHKVKGTIDSLPWGGTVMVRTSLDEHPQAVDPIRLSWADVVQPVEETPATSIDQEDDSSGVLETAAAISIVTGLDSPTEPADDDSSNASEITAGGGTFGGGGATESWTEDSSQSDSSTGSSDSSFDDTDSSSDN